MKYSAFSNVSAVQTYEEFAEDNEKDNNSQSQLTKIVGFMGVLLTLVGVVSNQLIGFESRKRENAVLLSTSMNRGTLKKMLFLETSISSAVSLIIAIPFGMLMYIPISKIMKFLGMSIPVSMNIGSYLVLMVLLLVVFSLTVIFPYFALRKMKLAEQLKYE